MSVLLFWTTKDRDNDIPKVQQLVGCGVALINHIAKSRAAV